MKRNLLAFGALIFAIALSSFTAKFNIVRYYVFNDSATQKEINNYQVQTSASTISGDNDVLAWIKVDEADGSISSDDFYAAFELLDETSTTSNSLNDEDEKTITDPGVRSATLEKKPS